MPDASSDLPAGPGKPLAVRLADYRPPPFLVDTVDLDVTLEEDVVRVAARLGMRRNPASDRSGANLRLDGENIELLSLAIDGAEAARERFSVDDKGLTVFGVPDALTLDIVTRLEPQNNLELSGLYKSGGNFCTQCEAEGFRRITYFPDRPDVMARFTTTIRADRSRYPVLLSNGNPVDSGDAGGGCHFVRWVDPHPKPCYLFALVAGDLVAVRDHFETASGRDIALAIWVRRGDEGKCDHAMRSLKAAMRWDETEFGLEYDLDVFNIVAVSDFNMGAMENKGLNIFNAKYVLAQPETATDADYQGIETVVAHEYFHNWTGNRVTCRDWFQLSLKEGLTVFRDQQFSADQGSPAVKRIADVRRLRATQFPEDSGPLAHPVRPESYIEINNFYTATVYQKGAEVVRMIRTLIGRDKFREGLRLYLARHDNSAATIEDFVGAMEQAAGIRFGAFDRWYSQAGTPEIEIEENYDPAAGRYRLTVRQHTPETPGQPHKLPQVIPLALALLAGDGRPLPARLEGENETRAGDRVLRVSDACQNFVFSGVTSRPVPSLLRDFSAPVRLRNRPHDQLRFLARHDDEPFARWEAGQQWATAHLLDLIARHQDGGKLALDRDFVEGIEAQFDLAEDDPAFAAEMLTLPSEGFLADQMAVMDVEAIHAVRQFARTEIGGRLWTRWRALIDTLADDGPYRIDGRAIGRRALRNLALSYLAATQRGEALTLVSAQFERAANMTDVLASLSILAELDVPARQLALDHFYERWQHDELVTDKWFAIQAISPLPGTLAAIHGLLRHPAFDLANPNKVRALIGAFSMSNQLRFHDSSGAGYEFLAEQIIALDAFNAQIAARMVTPLGTWRRLDSCRQALMRRALQRILDQPRLSKGTFEMATKSLA